MPQFTTTTGEYSLTSGISSNLVNDLAVTTASSGATIAAVTLQDFTPVQTQQVNGASTVWRFYAPRKASEEDGSVAFAPAPNNNNCILVNSSAFALSNTFCARLNGGVRNYSTVSLFGDRGGAIAFSPTQAGLVYLVSSSDRVYISQTYGRNATEQTAWPYVTHLVASPATSGTWLYALYPSFACSASSAARGYCKNLAYSNDGGQHWTRARYTSGNCPYASAVAVNPVSPNVVVLACYTQSGAEMFQSTDSGATFVPTTIAIPSDRRARGNDYAALFDSVTGSTENLKSDAALAFFALPTDLEYNPSPPAGQNPVLVLTTSRGGAMSNDDGATWTSIDGNAISTYWSGVGWSNGNALIATRGQGVLMAPLQTSSAAR